MKAAPKAAPPKPPPPKPPPPPPEPRVPARARRSGGGGGARSGGGGRTEGAGRLQARPDCVLLSGGQRRGRLGLGDGLPAGRDGVGDHRHRARLMQGLEGQSRHRGLDTFDLGHIGHR